MIKIIGRFRFEDRGPWPYYPYPPVIARYVLVRIMPGPLWKRPFAWLYLKLRGYGPTARLSGEFRTKMGRVKESPYSQDLWEAWEYSRRTTHQRQCRHSTYRDDGVYGFTCVICGKPGLTAAEVSRPISNNDGGAVYD